MMQLRFVVMKSRHVAARPDSANLQLFPHLVDFIGL